MKTKSLSSSSSWCVRQANRRCGAHANRRAAYQENHDKLELTESTTAAHRCSSADVDGGGGQQQVLTLAGRNETNTDGDVPAGAGPAAASRAQRADSNHVRTEATTTRVSPRRPLARTNDERHHSLLEWPSWARCELAAAAAANSELIIEQPKRAELRDTERETMRVGHAHATLDCRSLPTASSGSDTDSTQHERDSTTSSCHLSLAASDRNPTDHSARRVWPLVDRRERKRVEIGQAAVAANFVAVVDENNQGQNCGCQAAAAAADTKRHAREQEEERALVRDGPPPCHIGLDLTTRRRSASPREQNYEPHGSPPQPPRPPPEEHSPGGELCATPATMRKLFVISIISEHKHATTQKSCDVVGRAHHVINLPRLNYGRPRVRKMGAIRASGHSACGALISVGQLARCASLLLALIGLLCSPEGWRHQLRQPTATSHRHFNFLAFNIKSVHCATSSPPPRPLQPTSESSKFAFWLELERSLFEGSGAPSEAVSQLARHLAEWPDQRQAALFYLDQVAGPGGAACPSTSARRLAPVSLAQLMQPADEWPGDSLAQRVALDDLATAGSEHKRELNEYLTSIDSRATSSRLAQLAVDNANLIGRLLAMGERRAELNSSSAQDGDLTSDGEMGDDGRPSTEAPNFFNKLFRFRRQSKLDENVSPARLDSAELSRLEMVLRRLVSPKFMDYLLEFKAREWLTSGNNNKRLLHSLGMVMFNDDQDNDSASETGPIWFGSLAMVGRGGRVTSGDSVGRARSVTLIQNLYTHGGLDKSSALESHHLPSYLAKWLLEAASDNGPPARGQLDLGRKDGGWFSPQLECGHAPQLKQPRWLLTYSIPIYSHTNGASSKTKARPLGRASLRGVSFVSLDLARMGPLISQCTTSPSAISGSSETNHHLQASKRIPSFLAGTHHCQRIRFSQCVPLPGYSAQQTDQDSDDDDDDDGELAPLRPGTYVCKCPSSWPQVAPTERESTRAHREQLIELLDSRAALNSSLYALDQLAIERVTASLQWQQDGRDGNGVQQQHHRRQPLGGETTTTTTTTKAARMTGAFELTNKAAIARLLLLTRATTPTPTPPMESAGHGEAPGQGAAGASGARQASSGSATRRVAASGVGHFTLGAQLDAEAALDWFARSGDTGAAAAAGQSLGSTWPEEACQLCEAGAGQTPPARGPAATSDDDEVVSASSVQSALACHRPAATYAGGTWAASIARNGLALVSRSLRPVVLIGQLVCLALTLVLAGCLARIRKSRIILLSGGWLMLATMLLGALLLYASVLARYYQATSLTCLLEPWLRELGFSTFYGSILIKLYRILTEFQSRKAHRVCLRDKDQIVYLLAIVFIVIGYMSAWTALMVDGFFVRHQQAATVTSSGVGGFEPEQTTLNLGMDIRPGEGREGEGGARLAVRSALVGGLDDAGWRDGAQLKQANEAAAAAGRLGQTRLESQFGQQWQPQSKLMGELDGPKMGQITKTEIKRRDTTTPGGPSSAAENLLNEHLEILERGLNSFGELFLGLLESEPKFEPQSDTFVYLIRCRKLAWDYVTESSEIALLLFGVNLIYKLRNASSEMHKEKFILSLAVFIELVVSGVVYLARHALWHSLTSDHLLAMYFARCQLTVSLTVILVFAPKLKQVCRNKPGLLFGPSKFSALLRGGGGGDNAAGTSTGCHHAHAGEGGAPSSSSSSKIAGGRGASVRHRCHISCELHDHHLNDASRLQQAMLSNLSALEIGTINLADMDPDEIQAELKRVYTQLELLKTKVMRRDNPHISKRRGGRKPGHRKFSLQAFHHGRHSSGGGEHHSSMDRSGGVDSQASHELSAPRPAPGPGRARLPALAELEGELSPCVTAAATGELPQCTGTARQAGQAAKHVRVDESLNSQQDDELSSYAAAAAAAEPSLAINKKLKKYRQLLFSNSSSRSGTRKSTATNSNSSSARAVFSNSSGGGGQNGSSTLVSNQTTGGDTTGRKQNKWAPEAPSTSSLGGYLDDDVLMMTMNDSQSSGELTPQHRSSIVYSQSSFQQPQQHHRHLPSQPSASTSTADHLD